MQNELYKEYSALKQKISSLLEQETLLKEAIMQDLNKNKLEKVEGIYGKFTMSSRKSYEYSDKVKAMEEKVKLAKYKEVEQEVATVKETKYLTFTSNKE